MGEERARASRWLRRLGVFLGLGLVGGMVVLLLAAVWLVRRPWPQVAGTVAVEGLTEPVTVLRDRWGVPHIYADNLSDLFFAQGYVQAQDRLWQMEFNRRIGSGTLAAILGDGVLGFDRMTRALGLRRAAEREWSGMNRESRAVLEDFARGVNAYLESHRGRLALEFTLLGVDPDPWTPVDTLVTVKLMYWILAENASFELSRGRMMAQAGLDVARELLPPYSEGAPVIVPPEEEGYPWLREARLDGFRTVAPLLGTPGPNQGSNTWVVHGSRTATGSPLLATDTHLELFLPSVWYANGLHGGGLDAVGFTLAGTPAVAIGHNHRIAWGLADLVPDVQDFYIEELNDPANPTHYRFQGEWRELGRRVETVEVRGGKPVTYTVRETHHGPLVSELVGRFRDPKPLALAWTGEEGESLIQALLLLNRAGSWGEFREALRLWDGPHMSFVYADVDGNIGYQAVGRIPLRVPHHPGTVPVPGWTGEYEWQGYIPFDHLPWQRNPASGFVVAANQKAVSDEYPYSLGYEWADPYRALRITQLLAADGSITLEKMKRIQGDTYHLLAEVLTPHLLTVSPKGELEAQALKEMGNWNLRTDPGELAAAIYQVWYRHLLENTVKDELGEELLEDYLEYYWVHGPVMERLMASQDHPLFDDLATPERETREEIVRRSLTGTVAWLRERLGKNFKDWRWGRLHPLTFRHRPLGLSGNPLLETLFNHGPIPAPGGDRFTVNAAWFTEGDPDAPFAADAGAAQRIVVDLSDWDRSVAVNSTGQSEHLFHPHRKDLIRLWQALEYHPLPFSRQAVEAEAENVLVLQPRSREATSPSATRAFKKSPGVRDHG